jgi:hypothetical protein
MHGAYNVKKINDSVLFAMMKKKVNMSPHESQS